VRVLLVGTLKSAKWLALVGQMAEIGRADPPPRFPPLAALFAYHASAGV